jgi:Tol biopolymer transport system component
MQAHPHHPASAWRRAPAAVLLMLVMSLVACGGEDPLAPTNGTTDPLPAQTEPADAGASAALVTAQRIVFSSKRDGQYHIYRMDAAGQNVVRLTNTSKDDLFPALSFDGTRVALVRPRTDASNHVHNDIYIVNSDGTNGHWARSTPCSCELFRPSWSPNGAKLALTMSLNGTYYVAYLVLGTGQLGAYSTGYGGRPGTWAAYTPAGKIVYVGPTSKTLIQINADGSGATTLYTSSTPFGQPALSPDGKKLAYIQIVDPSLSLPAIYVKDFGTGTNKRLTWDYGYNSQPTWSPDGSRIAFVSTRTGAAQIWKMDASGGSLAQLTHTSTSEGYPSWSH